jgi:hypothetical protein
MEHEENTENIESTVDDFLERSDYDAATVPQTVGTIEDIFDPTIHAAGPEGKGIRTKSGKFRKKRLAADHQKSMAVNSFAQPAPPATFQFVQMTVDTLTMLACKYGGKDLEFSIDEKQMLSDVYSRYVHYKGWDDAATPETIVIGTTFMIVGAKLLPFIEKYLSRKKEDKNALPDNRQNTVREVNTSKGDSATSGKSGQNVHNSGPNPVGQMGSTIRVRSIG